MLSLEYIFTKSGSIRLSHPIVGNRPSAGRSPRSIYYWVWGPVLTSAVIATPGPWSAILSIMPTIDGLSVFEIQSFPGSCHLEGINSLSFCIIISIIRELDT